MTIFEGLAAAGLLPINRMSVIAVLMANNLPTLSNGKVEAMKFTETEQSNNIWLAVENERGRAAHR